MPVRLDAFFVQSCLTSLVLACELIHYGQELVKSQRTVTELSQAIFSAVTFHEMYRIAAQAALDEAGARKRRAAAGRALAQRNREIRIQEGT